MRAEQVITWQDCLIVQDDLIETIRGKMLEEPERGKLWQEKLALLMLNRQEILIKVEQEKKLRAIWDDEQEFMQSLQKICDGVLERSERQE